MKSLGHTDDTMHAGLVYWCMRRSSGAASKSLAGTGQYVASAPPLPRQQPESRTMPSRRGWSSRFEDGPPRPFFPLPSDPF